MFCQILWCHNVNFQTGGKAQIATWMTLVAADDFWQIICTPEEKTKPIFVFSNQKWNPKTLVWLLPWKHSMSSGLTPPKPPKKFLPLGSNHAAPDPREQEAAAQRCRKCRNLITTYHYRVPLMRPGIMEWVGSQFLHDPLLGWQVTC